MEIVLIIRNPTAGGKMAKKKTKKKTVKKKAKKKRQKALKIPANSGNKKAFLTLKDGTVFQGERFGAENDIAGEVVFNTAVVGYQEIITNPSSSGKIIALAYPEAGGYGVNDEDAESGKAHPAAVITRNVSKIPSSWRAKTGLCEYLKKENVPGLTGVDTRALLRHLKAKGEMYGVISSRPLTKTQVNEKIKPALKESEDGLAAKAATLKKYKWDRNNTVKGPGIIRKEEKYLRITEKKHNFHVAVIDCGIKRSFLKIMASCGFGVTVFPPDAGAEEIKKEGFRGLVVSNGPGNPLNTPYPAETVKNFLGKIPVLGIGLGCQALGLALGCETYRMKAGHRGCNHSIKNTQTGDVEVVLQDHGFALDFDSVEKAGAVVTHINLNDNTVEGIEARNKAAFGVQYYPQAGPGAHDAPYVFNKFIDYMKKSKGVS